MCFKDAHGGIMHKDLKPENVMMSSAKKAPIQERLGCFDV